MKWLVLAAIILAQQPAKAPEGKGTAESNNAQSTAHTKSTDSRQTPSAQSTPALTQAPVATEGQQSAAPPSRHTETSDQQTSDAGRATQRKLTLFTGVLAVVGVLQAGIMFLQLLVYRRQAHEMRRQRHEMVRQRAELTGQRTAMESQLEAMRGQLSQMENSGAQTAELIKHAARQVTALTDSAQAAKEMAEAARISAMTAENGLSVAEANARIAKASVDAFIHSQRPWLSVSVTLAGPLTYDEQGAHIALQIVLDNVGQIPATGVWITPVIYVQSPAKPSAIDERKRICSEITKAKREVGQVVFPGHPVIQRYGMNAPASEIEEACRAIFGGGPAADGGKIFCPQIIIAVGYRVAIERMPVNS
jgi:hypothetical protein